MLNVLRGTGAISLVHPAIAADLVTTVARSAAYWLQQKNQLVRVAQTFLAQGIPLIILKGAQLAQEVYPSPALRPMCDIDLMVPASELQRSSKVLQALGYACTAAYRLSEVLKEGCELPIHVHETGVAVDLHWHIESMTSGFTIDVEGLWQRARPSIYTPGALALGVEDQLLSIALHTVFHHGGQTGMIAFFDALYLCERHPVDWRAFVSTARAWRAEASAYAFLETAKKLFGTTVPDSTLDDLRTRAGFEAAAMLMDSLTNIEGYALPTKIEDRVSVRHLDKALRFSRDVSGPALLREMLLYPGGDQFRFRHLPQPLRLLLAYPTRWMRILRSTTSALMQARSNVHRARIDEGMKSLSHKQQLTRLVMPSGDDSRQTAQTAKNT